MLSVSETSPGRVFYRGVCYGKIKSDDFAFPGVCSPASTGEYTRRLECVRRCSRSVHYCGVNVPDETGKMSRSDKRGATLPKVATVVSLLRNDKLNT